MLIKLMTHFTGHTEIANLLRDAKTVSDKRLSCRALHEAVATSNNFDNQQKQSKSC